MKNILISAISGLMLMGCTAPATISQPQINKSEFDGSTTISYKPVNIVCSSAGVCPNLGFMWIDKSKDNVGVVVQVPGQIKAITGLALNVDGDIKSFNSHVLTSFNTIGSYAHSDKVFVVPAEYMRKASNASSVKIKISGPSYYQEGSLRNKMGEKIQAAKNLDALLEQMSR